MAAINKIFKWLWASKERMVLVIMVCILAFRIYQVIQPPEQVEFKVPPAPQSGEPEIDVTLEPWTEPEDTSGEWSALARYNPFWIHGSQGGGASDSGEAQEDLSISLVRIMEMPDGEARAQIQTETNKDWYEEGELFEEYELISIDPDTETVEIRSERLGRAITLEIE